MLTLYKWLLCFLFTNYITYKRNIQNTGYPLQDIFNIDNVILNKNICDIFPLISLILVNNYEKYLICHTYLLLLRFISFNVTILPAPMKLEQRFSLGIVPNYTYDLIFSGHTMTCVLSIFCVKQFIIPYTVVLSIICSLCVIITKEHYTIDVIVAWLATYTVVSLHTVDINYLLE